MNKNVVPVVDTALKLLDLIGASRTGISLADLVVQLGVPRSTVYRVLNTFLAHNLVSRADRSKLYRLGPKIRALNLLMPDDDDRSRLVEVAAPIMEAMVAKIDEACKLSVREGDGVITILTASSPSEYALNVRTGHRAPLYAGGAGKTLLAFADPADIERIAQSMQAFTPYTITDRETLFETLAEVRARNYAEDSGELRTSVHSIAAPVRNAAGAVIAALSVPFVGNPPPDRLRVLRQATIDAASLVTVALGGDGQAI